MSEVIFHDSDTLIELTDLTDVVTDSLINSASVTARILDDEGNALITGITLSSTGTGGDYRGTLDDADATANLIVGQTVTIEVTAVDGVTKRVFCDTAVVSCTDGT